eukprot:SAG31_NODE_3078_length_4708_cov_1.870471_6_plen_75_part_00
MEGALPSVLAGLVDPPVIAVPTSVGYGTNFHGVTPLLAMLTGCAPVSGISITPVRILLILRPVHKKSFELFVFL